jgi:hypothetical protein
MSRITLDEARDRNIWEGWFKEARDCRLDDGSLQRFLDHLRNDYLHDYGTSARATAAAAFATANAFARYEGLTGFQWSCVAMGVLGHMLFPDNKLGFTVINYDDLLYPQYEYRFTERKISAKGAEKLKQEARAQISESDGLVHPDVMAWWQKLANGQFPEWLKIEKGDAE